jgi:lysophospholipase L1-like esterase
VLTSAPGGGNGANGRHEGCLGWADVLLFRAHGCHRLPGLRHCHRRRPGAALGAAPVDVALLKFCYVDIEPGTDVKALFAAYRRTLAELHESHPATVFVHVTLPLNGEPKTGWRAGWKALARRLLGRPPAGMAENARREEYNRMVREAYGGREPLFDLARIESTAPDGTPVRERWRGLAAPALAPEYTEDGGHLNADGRRRAARELIAVLAAARAPQP